MTRPCAIWVLVVIGVLWAGMVAGDWFMRFYWFGWQESFLIRGASTESGPFEPLLVMTNPRVRGGDLTTLLGAPPQTDQYKEWKPAATNWTDEFGFRNRPPTVGRYYPIVVVGDSFMVSGPRIDDTFSGGLASVSGLPVYNYAYEGRGAFWAVIRFLVMDARFQQQTPKVLIWGLLEREVHGAQFIFAADYVDELDKKLSSLPGRFGIDLEAISKSALKKSLPNSSTIALLSSRIWNKVSYVLLGEASHVAVEAEGLIAGKEVLFYRPNIESMKRSDADRDAEGVATGINCFYRLCREKNIHLLVVLIPNKEQVYREHIPESLTDPDLDHPASVLYDVEGALKADGIDVVNLLPVFRSAAREGQLIYWTDDTHWNNEGIALAVQAVWPIVDSILVDE